MEFRAFDQRHELRGADENSTPAPEQRRKGMEAATIRDELQELCCEINPDSDIKPSQAGGCSEKDYDQDYFEN